jgi:DNA repair protein RadD
MTPRPYQEEAITAALSFLQEKEGNPCIVAPTGSGKSLILAEICRRFMKSKDGASVLILSHRKEILEQNEQKIRAVWPLANIGVYSAGLNSKRIRPITIAGIQSIAKVKDLPWFDLIIIDEVHLLPRSGEGQYRTLIKKQPKARILGLTATPERLDSGAIVGGDNILTEICYSISIKKLIEDGFLCPLRGKSSVHQADLTDVKKVAGEFVLSQAEAALDRDDITLAAVKEMIELGKDRKSWVVFASGVKHAEKVLRGLRAFGISSEIITGDTMPMIRSKVLSEFRAGRIRALVNVAVLTTGFDAPCIDMIALLRATASSSLYQQILGRGMRPHPNKQSCLVLDFAGNLERFGPIDLIVPKGIKGTKSEKREAPSKTCPTCRESLATAVRECPECGYIFPPPEEKIEHTAATGEFISTILHLNQPYEFSVKHSYYETMKSKKSGLPMFVAVHVGIDNSQVREFIFFENPKMRWRAEKWWKERSIDQKAIPTTCEDAYEFRALLRKVESLWVQREGKYQRVVSAQLLEETIEIEEKENDFLFL